MQSIHLALLRSNFLFLNMFLQLFNWRSALALIAIAIVCVSLFYSNFLAKKIAADEKRKIEQWVDAAREESNPYSRKTN